MWELTSQDMPYKSLNREDMDMPRTWKIPNEEMSLL